MVKRALLIIATVCAFFVGFSVPADAWPGVEDRERWHGYFKDREDTYGDAVFIDGFPAWVNDADSFIHFMRCKLNRGVPSPSRCNPGGTDQDRIGASFIIDTMISDNAPVSYVRSLPPNGAQVNDWEARIRARAGRAASNGLPLISWNQAARYEVNSYYQDDVGGAPRGDVAFFYEEGISPSIIFRSNAGNPIYVIRRECANPVGTLLPLPQAINYNATPHAASTVPQAQQGDTVRFNYSISNVGTATNPINCSVVRANRPAGYTPLPQQDANRPGSVPWPSCPVTVGANSTRSVGFEDVPIGNQAPGTKICRSLVINPKSVAGGPRASAEACVTIAKAPLAHFLGNDVWAGGNFADINAACSGASKIQTIARQLPDGSVAGSVGEYSAFALGNILAFGSGSKPLVNPASPIGKQMSFANTGANPGNFGASNHCVNDFLARFSNVPVSGLPASIDVDGRGSGVWRINGNHSFRGNLANGKRQVYIVQNGIVTVDNDIRYSNNYNGLGDIPSLVIISMCTTPATCGNVAATQGHIRVNNNVGQMDGLYIAKNTFNTCANVGDPLTVSSCNLRLTVNGGVIARNILLRRTAGADGASPTARKQPAEVFNFTNEMYLSSALQQASRATVETVNVRELPPRF